MSGIWCLPLSDLLHLVWHSLGSSILLQMAIFHSFYGWGIFYCIYTPHFLYSFICPWTFRLLPSLGLASQVAVVVKNLPANAGDIRDMGSIPELGRFPGGGHGNPLQDSCLENPMDRGVQWAAVHGVTRVRHDWSNLVWRHACLCCCKQCCYEHRVRVSFQIRVFSGYMPRSGLLDHMLTLFLVF